MITQSIPRRGFLGAFAAALMLDPERLLWVPGKKLITLPKRAVSYVGVGMSFKVGDVLLCSWGDDEISREEIIAVDDTAIVNLFGWGHAAIMSPTKQPWTKQASTGATRAQHNKTYGHNPLPNKFRSMLGRQDA